MISSQSNCVHYNWMAHVWTITWPKMARHSRMNDGWRAVILYPEGLRCDIYIYANKDKIRFMLQIYSNWAFLLLPKRKRNDEPFSSLWIQNEEKMASLIDCHFMIERRWIGEYENQTACDYWTIFYVVAQVEESSQKIFFFGLFRFFLLLSNIFWATIEFAKCALAHSSRR